MKDIRNYGMYTNVIHAGQHPDPLYGGIIIPKTKELHDKIHKSLVYNGGTMDPHQA